MRCKDGSDNDDTTTRGINMQTKIANHRVTAERAQAMRVRPARIIRTASQAPTEPIEFAAGIAAEAWIREMREGRRG